MSPLTSHINPRKFPKFLHFRSTKMLFKLTIWNSLNTFLSQKTIFLIHSFYCALSSALFCRDLFLLPARYQRLLRACLRRWEVYKSHRSNLVFYLRLHIIPLHEIQLIAVDNLPFRGAFLFCRDFFLNCPLVTFDSCWQFEYMCSFRTVIE